MTRAKVQANQDESFKAAWHVSLFDPRDEHPDQPPVKALADVAGMNYSALCATADDATLDWISMRRFLRLLPALRNLHVLDYLERLVGRIAFRIPDQRELCGEQMGKAIKEFGEFVVEGSHGGWTVERAQQLRKEAEEAAAAILHFAHCVELQAQPERELRAVGGAR